MTMLAKAAGLSLQKFISNYLIQMDEEDTHILFLNYLEIYWKFLKNQRLNIVSSQIKSGIPLINLIKFSKPGTLLINIYRNENDWLLFAIKHIIELRI